MKKLITLILSVICIGIIMSACSSSDEPVPPKQDEPIPLGRWTIGGFFMVHDGDTIEITETTLTIPKVETSCDIDIYSNGMDDRDVGSISESNGLSAILINPIEDIFSPSLPPVDWPMVSCMNDRRDIEAGFRERNIYKQTIRITPDPANYKPGEPRTAVILLEQYPFHAMLTLIEQQ